MPSFVVTVGLVFQCKMLNEEFDGVLHLWDLPYYATMIEETDYSVNKEALREYFPLERVTEGMMSIFQYLVIMPENSFGLRHWRKFNVSVCPCQALLAKLYIYLELFIWS
jgi:Zn-dependent oligopeptidase